MKEKIMNFLREEEGQGMTEYIIIVGVIAILLIIVAYKYGGEVKNLFTSATNELSTTNQAVSGAGADGVQPY